jgi:Putative metallopeptidase
MDTTPFNRLQKFLNFLASFTHSQLLSLRNLQLTSLLVFALSTSVFYAPSKANAEATIEVSNKYRAIHDQGKEKIKVGFFMKIRLPWNDYHDSYAFMGMAQSNGISLLVVDASYPKSKPLISKKITAHQPLIVSVPASKSDLFILLDNDTNADIDIQYRVDRIGTRGDDAKKLARSFVSKPVALMNSIFQMPDMKLIVQPCGFENAYSTPNVIVCTELINHLWVIKADGALDAIIFHEFAHSLLKIWNLPGWDNEDLADEFSAMLISSNPDMAKDFIKWFDSHNSKEQAINQLLIGDKHTISVQRARNIKKVLSNPEPVINRWVTLLASHMKGYSNTSKPAY